VESLEINHIHFVFRKPVEICHAMTTRFRPPLLSVPQIPRLPRAQRSSVFKRRLFPVYSNRSCSSRESRIVVAETRKRGPVRTIEALLERRSDVRDAVSERRYLIKGG
jgi:hypothetical protein